MGKQGEAVPPSRIIKGELAGRCLPAQVPKTQAFLHPCFAACPFLDPLAPRLPPACPLLPTRLPASGEPFFMPSLTRWTALQGRWQSSVKFLVHSSHGRASRCNLTSLRLSVCPSVRPSVVRLSVRPSVRPSIRLSVLPSVRPSVPLSLSLASNFWLRVRVCARRALGVSTGRKAPACQILLHSSRKR